VTECVWMCCVPVLRGSEAHRRALLLLDSLHGRSARLCCTRWTQRIKITHTHTHIHIHTHTHFHWRSARLCCTRGTRRVKSLSILRRAANLSK
jgi:hypothetical protein